MNAPTHPRGRLVATLPALIALAFISPHLPAQDGRPGPERPLAQSGGEVDDESNQLVENKGGNGPIRREVEPGKVQLGLSDVSIDTTFSLIAEWTGKVVMPVNLTVLKTMKITLLSDGFIERAEALDMLFRAFRLNQVGVIEKNDVVIVGNIDELMTVRQMPVLTAEDDVADRSDLGSLVVKLFRLEKAKAEDVGELIGEDLPAYATVTVDPNSNQVVVMGDIALCQHLEQIIEQLDHTWVEPKTQTFRLAHADATEISENILDLFETDETAGRTSRPNQPRRPTRRPGARTGTSSSGPPVAGAIVGPEIELRVTVNILQNSVTVTGRPSVVEEVARLINEEWDLPRPTGTSKIYTLQYTDPLMVAEKLNSLLGQATGGVGGRGGARGGAAGGTGVTEALSGIYRIEAYPDTRQLLVFSKTEDSIEFLDSFIEDLDQPTDLGLPFVVELKHADAFELAQELNVLLAEAGTGVGLEAPDRGPLSGREEGGEGTTTTGGGSAGTINFPWERGGRQTEDKSPESALLGRIRIVPIIRQNALAVLCPRPQEDSVRELIELFDRPGRQVMISAVIAEIELTDDLALGLRFSNSDNILGGTNPDFRLGGGFTVEGTENEPFKQVFDTSTLNANLSVNIVLQALAQKTNVRIIQEPIVFTADNQEALFFDGQDVPLLTGTSTTAEGTVNETVDYAEVGVTLNVRPRITVERDVDLEISLELSSVVAGVTISGSPVLDRRETTTHVIVKNEQTVIISGIRRDVESKVKRGIPLLSDIPLIGDLFASHENTTTTTELLAFITPRVVDNPSENDINFQAELREQLHELTRPVDEQRRDFQRNRNKVIDRIVPDHVSRPQQRGGQAKTAPVDIDEVAEDQ